MFKAAIITASDKGYKGLREDLSGSCIKKILEEANYEVVSIDVLPDERNLIADKLIELSDKKNSAHLHYWWNWIFSTRQYT